MEVNDSATIAEGATSSNLNILSNDTDSPDNGTLAVYSVGGTTFASLTDSTDSTYTSANGYKQVAGTYGTLYIKSTGESYYVHDGGDDGGQTDTFSYVATDGTNQDTSSAGTISLSITAVDDTPPVEVNDSATINEGATSSNLSILDNDTDSPDDGTLAVYSVGGTTFASLTDSTDSTYTSANGYKQVAGTYGTLYIKSTGESYYVHDGGDDGGQTDSFSYVATPTAPTKTPAPLDPSPSASPLLMTPLRWKSTTPLPSTRAQPPASSPSSTTTPILPITAPSPSTASVARPSRH